jgi:hypothetical protein
MRSELDPPEPQICPNPRGDDAWDNDAVHWLLLQDRGTTRTRGALIEALRRQNRLVMNRPNVVADAVQQAARFGVRQVEVPRSNRTITRLIRTHPGAPSYPSDRTR